MIETLLETSTQCEFPCWGEMIPGKTSWEDAVARLRGFGFHKGGTDFLQYALLDMSWCPTCGEGKLAFVGREGRVATIRIAATVPGDVDPEGMLSTYLAQFHLSEVLKRYGAPSHIYVESEWGFYDEMWVEYASLGLLINYSVDTISDAVGPLVCPVMKGTQDIALNLQPPGSTFQTYRDNIRIVSELNLDGIELKEIEGVSPGDFYAAFQQADSASCLRMVDAASDYLKFTPVLPADFSRILRPEEDAPLLELLTTNSGCELPCWWGITPGVTPMQDVQALFASYGKAMGIWNVDGTVVYEMGLWGRHDPQPLDYVVRHKFTVQDGIVSTIYVRGTPPVYFYGWGDGPSPRFRMEGELPALMHSHYLTQDWQRYSLFSMLAHFGVPVQVVLHYNHQLCGNEYLLGIAYDDLGVFIQYNGEARHENDTVVICPSLEEATNFHLVLTTPDSGIEFADYMTRGYWGAPASLEAIGSMSPDIFYRTYVDPATSVCITVPEKTEYTCP